MSRRTRFIVVAAVVIALVGGSVIAILALSGGGSKKAAPTTSKATTTLATTTTKPPPVAPLTGLPDPGGQSLTRPALSVKVENTADARPQTGIDQADVVYEEVVEGGITRFIAIFNSTVPDVIGPVRSVRGEDPDILWPLGGIFAYSGGAQVNVDAINAAPVHAVDESEAGDAMVRNAEGQPPRDAPHNLYGLGPKLFALGGKPVPPSPLFQYLAPDAKVGGKGVLSMHVGFDAGYDPTWDWDGGSGTWKRSLDGAPSTVVGGAQIAPTNVVVQFTPYSGEAEGQTVGQGDVWVFTDGTVRMGHWMRPDKTQPARYVDDSGAPILLRPGRTWVELLPAGSTVDINYAPAPPPTVPTTIAPTTTTRKKR